MKFVTARKGFMLRAERKSSVRYHGKENSVSLVTYVRDSLPRVKAYHSDGKESPGFVTVNKGISFERGHILRITTDKVISLRWERKNRIHSRKQGNYPATGTKKFTPLFKQLQR